jgi:hypothetical protein
LNSQPWELSHYNQFDVEVDEPEDTDRSCPSVLLSGSPNLTFLYDFVNKGDHLDYHVALSS